jgi:hypothetical protein
MAVTDIVLKFKTKPKGEHLRYFQYWELSQSIVVKIANGDLVTIPSGFGTDLSSVPRVLWPVMPPFGNFLVAAITHDYLYHINYLETELGTKEARKLADDTMLYLSNKYNNETIGQRIDNHLRYAAVRLFGAKIYKK